MREIVSSKPKRQKDPVKRVEGVIMSWVPGKPFGFVKGRDGSEYFLHANNVDDQDQVAALEMGRLIEFEPHPGRKGLEARHVMVGDATAVEWIEPERFVVSKDVQPRYGEVYFCVDKIQMDGDSPDEAKTKLLNKCRELGANAVVGLAYSRSTGSMGNYLYTIHWQSGWPAIVLEKRATFDVERAESSAGLGEALAETLQRRYDKWQAELARKAKEKAEIEAIVYWLKRGFGLLLAIGLIAFLIAMD